MIAEDRVVRNGERQLSAAGSEFSRGRKSLNPLQLMNEDRFRCAQLHHGHDASIF